MTNMDKLLLDARAARQEAESALAAAVDKRRAGDAWSADLLEMDAKYAAEEAAVLLGKVLLISLRIDAISQFERRTGTQFDARHMDVPQPLVVTSWVRSPDGALTLHREEN